MTDAPLAPDWGVAQGDGMIEWRDQGICLGARPHGESAAIVEVFTAHHGRHAGVVRGGAGRKMAATLQPGTQMDVVWRARLEDHIGAFTVEPVHVRAGLAMGDPVTLLGLGASVALLQATLPERAAQDALYQATVALFDLFAYPDVWPAAHLRWELLLLDTLGFALDLSSCAVTGAVTGLEFVSPRSGRAVTRVAAGDWADRLLPLPPCLTGTPPADLADIAAGLGVTGHFLAQILAETGARLPEARGRYLAHLAG